MYRKSLSFLAAAGFAGLRLASAGSMEVAPPSAEPAPSPWVFSSELNSEASYVTPANVDGRRVSEQHESADFVFSGQKNDGPVLRFGAGWERFSFSSTSGTRAPNTLQSEALIVGMEFQIGSSIFGRIEVQPGFYDASSRVNSEAFDVPITAGASYLYNKDVQFVLGFLLDPERSHLAFPGGGLRWQINDQWLLNAVLPRPRLEYKLNSDVSLFGGASVLGNSYRTDSLFGKRVGNRSLNSAWVDYTEIRIGGGASLKVNQLSFDVEIGYLAYREFDFHRAEVSLSSGEGSFYAALSLQAKF